MANIQTPFSFSIPLIITSYLVDPDDPIRRPLNSTVSTFWNRILSRSSFNQFSKFGMIDAPSLSSREITPLIVNQLNSIKQEDDRSIKEIADIISSYLGDQETSQDNESAIHLNNFLPFYKMCISPQIASWNQADIFLLGEAHKPTPKEKMISKEWTVPMQRVINGAFISYLSQFYPLYIFLEGKQAMEEERSLTKVESYKKEYCINSASSNIFFYGWDEYGWDEKVEASSETLKTLNIKALDLTKEREEYEAQIQTLEQELEALVPGLSMPGFSWIEIIPSLSDQTYNQILEKFSQRNVLRKKWSENVDEYVEIQKKFGHLCTEMFPARTQSMISTLHHVQQRIADGTIQGKVIFIAGEFHLVEDRDLNLRLDATYKEKRSLASLYKELVFHKAAVMSSSLDF